VSKIHLKRIKYWKIVELEQMTKQKKDNINEERKRFEGKN
jgi:hypothetical protein